MMMTHLLRGISRSKHNEYNLNETKNKVNTDQIHDSHAWHIREAYSKPKHEKN